MRDIFDYLKNFGFKNEVEVVMPGTNAKMNEMQSLMGIMVLAYLDDVIQKRAQITELYRSRLLDVPGVHLVPPLPPEVKYNHGYMPIEVDEKEFGMSRDALYKELMKYNVFSRRYFYPLLCDYSCYRSLSLKDLLTVARRATERILTLPIYDSLALADVGTICDMIVSIQKSSHARRS